MEAQNLVLKMEKTPILHKVCRKTCHFIWVISYFKHL